MASRMRTMFLAALLVALTGSSVVASHVIGYAETLSLFANQTVLSYDPAHGTQVEYMAASGKSFLLYPGNTVIVPGLWKLASTPTPNAFNLCFKYPSNSYDPTTGAGGGGWECQIAGFYLRGIVERATGDVLGLARQRQVPFRLSPARTTLAALVGELPK